MKEKWYWIFYLFFFGSAILIISSLELLVGEKEVWEYLTFEFFIFSSSNKKLWGLASLTFYLEFLHRQKSSCKKHKILQESRCLLIFRTIKLLVYFKLPSQIFLIKWTCEEKYNSFFYYIISFIRHNFIALICSAITN